MIFLKFRLNVNRFGPDGSFDVQLPEGSRALCIEMEDGFPCLWLLAPVAAPTITHRFVCFAADTAPEKIGDIRNLIHVGAFRVQGNTYHLFDRTGSECGSDRNAILRRAARGPGW